MYAKNDPYKNSFIPRTIPIWNRLPLDTVNSRNTETFKLALNFHAMPFGFLEKHERCRCRYLNQINPLISPSFQLVHSRHGQQHLVIFRPTLRHTHTHAHVLACTHVHQHAHTRTYTHLHAPTHTHIHIRTTHTRRNARIHIDTHTI